MEESPLPNQEGIDNELFEDIKQLKIISLGEGAAVCQVCGRVLREGAAITAYAFRRAESLTFQIGFVMCGDNEHEHPTEYTLGVRELLIAGRIGRCVDIATQSDWPVLLAPEALAVSAAATRTVRDLEHPVSFSDEAIDTDWEVAR